jgi:glycosyltransferase involved in cell wall biosynthesis
MSDSLYSRGSLIGLLSLGEGFMNKRNPTLSIVVTSYAPERLKDIGELLDCLQQQTYDTITEIIFVVEQSVELHDGIKQFITNKSKLNARILFNAERLGICAARNLGAREAHGDIIAYIDDDALPFQDWAEQIVRTFDDNSIIGVTGPAVPLWDKANSYATWFPEELYWVIGCTAWFDNSKIRAVRNAWGMNMSFRKESFNYCQFSESLKISPGVSNAGKVGLVGDDTEFSLNLTRKTGKLIVYNPEVKVKHRVYDYRLTPLFIRRQAYWQGYTKAVLSRLYGDDNGKRNMMNTEYQLLRRILFRLLPSTMIYFFRHPQVARRKFSLTYIVLYHLGFGYLSGKLPVLGRIGGSEYGTT